MTPASALIAALFLSTPAQPFQQAPSESGRIPKAVSGPVTTSVFGRVIAADDGRAIAGAEVRVEATRDSVSTDATGHFAVRGLSPGRYRIRATAPGYQPGTRPVEVSAGQAAVVVFRLGVAPIVLPGLVARAASPTTEAPGPKPDRFAPADLRAVASIGEADVLRTVQRSPAVAAGSDYSSALHVRGGSSDGSAVTLDGVPLFNPYHLAGLNSAINADVVSAVTLWPGATPAWGEDRTSGEVDIKTRTGDRARTHARGGIGILGARVALDGPLPGHAGSYVVSMRRSYVGALSQAVRATGLTDNALPYGFQDVYAKVVVADQKDTRSLTAFGYENHDALDSPRWLARTLESSLGFSWGGQLAGLRYDQRLGARTSGRVQIATSSFGGDFSSFRYLEAVDTSGERLLGGRSRMRDLRMTADVVFQPDAHRILAGGELDRYAFEHHVDGASGWTLPIPDLDVAQSPTTAAAFIEDEWRPLGSFSTRVGLRYLSAGDLGSAWLPRLALTWEPAAEWSVSLGAGRYAQAFHSLKNEDAPGSSLLAYDFYAAVPPSIGLSRSEDLALELAWSRKDIDASLTAYTRSLDPLPLPPTTDRLVGTPVISDGPFLKGSETVRGLELSSDVRSGPANISLAYTWLFAEMGLEGRRYPASFERRHTLDLQTEFDAGRWGHWTGRLQAATGQPYTPILGVAWVGPIPQEEETYARRYTNVLITGDHNSARLPGYLRLDVGARFPFDLRLAGRTHHLAPYLYVINLLNTANALSLMPPAWDPSAAGSIVLNYAPQLPLLPSVGLEWSW